MQACDRQKHEMIRKLTHSLMRYHKLLPLGLILLVVGGCSTHPKEYNGRPVVGVKWSEGEMVYILGPKAGEKEEIERIAREGIEAASDVKFSGTKGE